MWVMDRVADVLLLCEGTGCTRDSRCVTGRFSTGVDWMDRVLYYDCYAMLFSRPATGYSNNHSLRPNQNQNQDKAMHHTTMKTPETI